MKKKLVVVLSGGLDSVVLMHHLAQTNTLRALSINYGQRHSRELEYAEKQAKLLNIPWALAHLSSLAEILPGSSQTDPTIAVPQGHYEEASMKATVVPNRNMILLAVAIGHAIAHGCEGVAYAAHAGDHAIYPDCRPVFADAMATAAGVCHYHPISLLRPFVNMDKAKIVTVGSLLKVDFSQTWSCYEGGKYHCGKCGTCVERIGAFMDAGVEDPTIYLDKHYALSVLARGFSPTKP